MNKIKKTIYWIATIWLSLGMASTGIVQLLKMDQDIERMALLQYPVYLLTLLGVWKILGVIVILLPKLPIVKEWAYAGFFFTMSGAAYSHISSGSPFSETFPSILLLVLTIVSWYFRPAGRKMMLSNQ